MKEHYLIVGGGPTGLLLSLLLGLSNYRVTILEKDFKLGGSWKVEWKKGYFTENSPRILHSAEETFNKLLSYLDIVKNDEFNYVYGNIINSNLKLAKYFYNQFTLSDWYKFIFASLYYRFFRSKFTVEDWINESKLSDLGAKAIRTFSIAISDRSDNVMVNDMFGSVEIGYFYQLANPEKWINRIKTKLDNMHNVNVFLNSEILSIQANHNNVDYMSVKINGVIENIRADHYVLTIPPLDLLNLLYKSDSIVKNNWMSFDKFINWAEKSSYIGFGFQLHFKEKLKFPKPWCWSCRDEWVIMILPTSDYADNYSEDPNINTVWSACIVDMDKKSSRLNKTPNECNAQEILNECERLIKNGYKNLEGKILPKYKVTTSYGLKKIDNKWVSKNSSFSRNYGGYLPITGNIKNLYSVGPHNNLDHWSIVTINRALNSALNFIKKKRLNALCFYKKGILYYLKYLVYLIIIFLIYRFYK